MKFIELTQSKQAIVDDEDYEYLNQWKWHFCVGYAFRKAKKADGKRKRENISIHRTLIKCLNNQEVDHINGNKLDNRKCNLRLASRSQNRMNSKSRKGSSSKYKGVYWYSPTKKWRSLIYFNKNNIHLGYFNSEKEAALAYNSKAKEIYKEFAKLNNIKENRK